MNVYFKQEKWQLAQNQLHTQTVSLKTAISSQIATLKNVLSSYEYEISEGKINWIQLDPFFGIASVEKSPSIRQDKKLTSGLRVTKFIGRSGSVAENWNAAFLQSVLSQKENSENHESSENKPIKSYIFQDRTGSHFMILKFSLNSHRSLVVVGRADYFQKYFDVNRGEKVVSMLFNREHMIAAHAEADYLGTVFDESAISTKKFLVEQEEIAGTNLVAMNYMSKKLVSKGMAIPWSIVGLILGFGFMIIGVLIYTMDPLEKRIEKYRKQEREQIFKDTLSEELSEGKKVNSDNLIQDSNTTTSIVQQKNESEKINNSLQNNKMSNMLNTASTVLPPPPQTVLVQPIPSSASNLPLPPPPPSVKTIPPPAFSVSSSIESKKEDTKTSSSSFFLDKDEKTATQFVLEQDDEDLFSFTKKLANENQISAHLEDTSVDFKLLEVESNLKNKIDNDLDDDLSEKTHVPLAEVAIDTFDLDQVLSLDDIESEIKNKSQMNFLQDTFTSRKINIQETAPEIQKPQFALKRKTFKVDEIPVTIRRPERT